MPESYSYSMRRTSDALVREVTLDCPTCHGGVITLEIAEDRKNVLAASHFDCAPNCSVLRYNGAHDTAIAAAIAYANRIEEDGPTESQLESLYATDGVGAAERHELAAREARRFK